MDATAEAPPPGQTPRPTGGGSGREFPDDPHCQCLKHPPGFCFHFQSRLLEFFRGSNSRFAFSARTTGLPDRTTGWRLKPVTVESSLGLPSVTIIIAARPGETDIASVRAARQLDYPASLLEVLVARGRQPSVQRNQALRAARGELIYFLDDDSIPKPDNLRRVAGEFANPGVAMAGGPNLCPAEAPPLEQAFALVMASPLAFGPSAARYRRAGRPRETSEKELILCNLIVRRQAIMELGGFDEALYPNEENALMDNLQKRGLKLLYHPDLVVYRRPRPTLAAFARMLRNYGRGRAEQFRRHPTAGSALNFVPPLFLVYLLLTPWLPRPLLWPLALYAAAVLAQTAVLAKSRPGALLRLPLLLALSHLLYGAGFWRGLFTKLGPAANRPAPEVKLERVSVTARDATDAPPASA